MIHSTHLCPNYDLSVTRYKGRTQSIARGQSCNTTQCGSIPYFNALSWSSQNLSIVWTERNGSVDGEIWHTPIISAVIGHLTSLRWPGAVRACLSVSCESVIECSSKLLSCRTNNTYVDNVCAHLHTQMHTHTHARACTHAHTHFFGTQK